VRETLILFQRCTLVRRHPLLPFCRSSSVRVHLHPFPVAACLLLLVYRPSSTAFSRLPSSTVVFSPSFVRLPSSSAVIRPFRIAARLRHRQRFARQLDRTSSSSVVSQAVLRAVVCWSEEDNSIPFYTGFELSLKFPFDHFYN